MQFRGYAYISRFYVCVYANASCFCLSAVFFMTSQRGSETVSSEFKQLHESFQSLAQRDSVFFFCCTYVGPLYTFTYVVRSYLCLQGASIKILSTLSIK